MAATDRFYRNQKALDVVFAVSCIAMLLSVLWMFWQDYNREYKVVQRQFRDVETAMNEHLMLENLPDTTVVAEKRAAVETARTNLNAKKQELKPTEQRLIAQRDIQDEETRSLKAEFDSKSSLYVIEVENRGRAQDEEQRQSLEKSVQAKRQELDKLEQLLADAQSKLNRINTELKEKVTTPLSSYQDALAAAEDDLKKTTGIFDRYAKAAALKKWKLGDSFRQWPVADAFNPSLKIQQITLPDLTIDYGGFKDVPRYDRCTSCHLGIEKGTYDHEALERLTQSPRSLREEINRTNNRLHDLQEASPQTAAVVAEIARVKAQLDRLNRRLVAANGLEEKLQATRALLIERSRTEKLGFDPTDLPDHVRYVKMTKGQITQFAAHPRMDLFVDSNSPHAVEKFGCTTCHAGQGSATDFLLAAHSPSNSEQEEEWKKNYDWSATHDWEFPMMSSRFTESTCLKCHHQVTDMIRYGSKEEAPKLLRGYNLIKEVGCFGCHEIAGVKGGRWVGPDLRAEPTPAVEYLPATEQERLKADPLSPPGALRKAGPSLRRIAEKTNEVWARKWIMAPRDFRPDTRMPHFYGLSTNNENALPDDQKSFPHTEIDAIAHYLFEESKGALSTGPKTAITPDGDDTYRSLLRKELEDLEANLAKSPLPERDPVHHRDLKTLQEVTRKLTDLALLSVPSRAADINSTDTELRQVQGLVQELNKKKVALEPQRAKLKAQLEELNKKLKELKKQEEVLNKKADAAKGDEAKQLEKQLQDNSDEQSKVEADEKPIKQQLEATTAVEKELIAQRGSLEKGEKFGGALARYTTRLIELARITRIEKEIVDHRGNAVKVPEAAAGDPKKLANGRRLFTERGCLACHQHEGTTKGDAALRVDGSATFAPDLSRVAAKLAPEVGGKDGARRWLIQWVLNPSLYHPRTRMPVTHLSVPDAADVADFLLSEKSDWKGPEVEEPTHKELIALARVYLAKAPGMTRDDVDAYLPAATEKDEGIPQERMKGMPADADERRLQPPPGKKQVADGDLKWYIGRKAISRMGCFGCHDIPGFESTKPIGTALNDWGKKDPARIAFEEADVYVKEHHNIVEARDDGGNKNKPAPEWHSKDGKRPYEKIFYDLLEHQHREGFLHQKLMEPRSYDYNRIRAWDDRLRMPQFKFSRGLKRYKGESDQAYEARQDQAEAEAREAVMTFILGLVADPVPLKYVNNPGPERLAEVKGRQVIDKFNCAGCHVIHPGVYDLKPTPDLMAHLQDSHRMAAENLKTDFFFPGHNAWEGPAPTPDRLRVFGTDPTTVPDRAKRDVLSLRLAEAVRFTGTDGLMRDLPAGLRAQLVPEDIMAKADTLGGTFTELMLPYMQEKYKTDLGSPDKARSALPPPLNREGERVQPKWLYGFLLDPPPIRAEEYMKLRMPKFNMSPDEARALVDYFGASAKTRNPGAGITFPFLTLAQREERFWRNRAEDYVARLSDKDKQARMKGMQSVWEEHLKQEVAGGEARVAAAEQAVTDAKKSKDKDLIARAEKELKQIQDNIKQWNAELKEKNFNRYHKRWVDREAYAGDAMRLLANPTSVCLTCHSIGNIKSAGAKGPNLALAAERLRPQWVELWIANPPRMLTYDTIMPQNFPKGSKDVIKWKEFFDGDALQDVKALRDVLMDLPRLADEIPGHQALRRSGAGGGK